MKELADYAQQVGAALSGPAAAAAEEYSISQRKSASPHRESKIG